MMQYLNEKRMTLNESSFNILIDMYSTLGEVKRMEEIYQEMLRSGFKPDVMTFTSMLKGHTDTLNIDSILEIVERMLGLGVAPNMKTFTLAFKACISANDTKATLKLFRKMNEAQIGNPKAMQVIHFFGTSI